MRFKGLDLNLIPVLDSVLEHRSTTRAALDLNLSQPAISAALNRLRAHFNDPLLVVQGRTMVPTAFARQLQPHVKALLGNADVLVSTSSAFDPARSIRTFRICISDYLTLVTLRPLLRRLAVEAPGLTFELLPLSETITAQLDRGDLDLLISPIEYLSSEHPITPLLEERYVLAGWSGNPLMAGPVSADDFCRAGHIAVRLGSINRTSFAESQLRALGIERRIEVYAYSFAVVADLLIGTNRIAIMHERLALYAASVLPITTCPMPFEFPRLIEGLQLHRTRTNDAGLQWLTQEICAATALHQGFPTEATLSP